MSRLTRLATALDGLFVVASVVHYALFGALPRKSEGEGTRRLDVSCRDDPR